MNMQHRRRTPLAASLLLVFGLATTQATGAPPEWVMTRGQAVPDRDLPAEAARGSGIASTLNPAALGAPGLFFPLADGRVLHATRQRVAEDEARGRRSWIGTFDDEPGSFVVLTQARGVTTGFITYGAETFELAPTRGGKHVIYAVDAAKLPDVEPVVLDGDAAADTGGTTDYGTGGAVADGGHVHDLLVVYTPASAARYGAAALESRIVAAVNAANQAYLNSGVNITLNLVGLQQVPYTEPAGISEALYDLRGTTDGKMDTVHALRDSLGADLVSLISENSDACGIGFLMRSESGSFASSAFNVVYSSCLSQHSLAHELGHNQGNMHDRASSSNAGTFEYSYGHRRCATDGTGFRTVMSYSCSGASRVTQFSNPAVSYNGYPTGVSFESDPANSAENVRSMNLTADTVAAFRAGPGGTSGGGSGTGPDVPASPSSLKASAASASSVTVSWSDNSGDEAGFKLERSANGVDFAEIATLGANATGFADTGLSAKTSYWYRVRAFNSAGLSGYSNTGAATTPDVAPAAPSSVSAQDNGDGSAGVSWVDASSNETGFEVRRETWDSRRSVWKGPTTVGTVPAGVTSLVDLAGSGTYRYTVRAVSAGAASSFAGPAEVSVTGGSSKKGGGGKGRTRN
jgi:hypothetical protein